MAHSVSLVDNISSPYHDTHNFPLMQVLLPSCYRQWKPAGCIPLGFRLALIALWSIQFREGCFSRKWVLGGSCLGVYHFHPFIFGSQFVFRGRPKCRIFFNAGLRFALCRRLFCLLLLDIVLSFMSIWHCSLPLVATGISIVPTAVRLSRHLLPTSSTFCPSRLVTFVCTLHLTTLPSLSRRLSCLLLPSTQ